MSSEFAGGTDAHPDTTTSPDHSTPAENTPATQASLCSLLADETRIRILQVLCAVDGDGSQCDGLSFSTLRRRVAVEDSGRFNYHLDQLTDELVAKRDGRYVLTPTGNRLIRALSDSARSPEDNS